MEKAGELLKRQKMEDGDRLPESQASQWQWSYRMNRSSFTFNTGVFGGFPRDSGSDTHAHLLSWKCFKLFSVGLSVVRGVCVCVYGRTSRVF